jgi:hypothetical protein
MAWFGMARVLGLIFFKTTRLGAVGQGPDGRGLDRPGTDGRGAVRHGKAMQGEGLWFTSFRCGTQHFTR